MVQNIKLEIIRNMHLKKTCYWICFFLFISVASSENSDPCQSTGYPWYKVSNGRCCPCKQCHRVYVRGRNDVPVQSECLKYYSTAPADGTPRLCVTTCSQHCRPLKEVLRGKHNNLIDKKCPFMSTFPPRPPPSEIPTTTKPTSPLSIAKNTSEVPSQVTSNRPSLKESNLNITTTLIVGGGISAFLVFIIVVLIMLCTKCRNGGQEDELFRCRKGRKNQEDGGSSIRSAPSSSSTLSDVTNNSRQDIWEVVPRNQQPRVHSALHSGAVPEGSWRSAAHPETQRRLPGEGASTAGIPTAAGSNAGAPQNTPMMSLGNGPVVHGNVYQAAGNQHITNNFYSPPLNGIPLFPEQHLMHGGYQSNSAPASCFTSSDFRRDDDLPTKRLTSEQPKAFTAPAPVRDAANFPIRTTLTEQDQVSGPADASFTKDFNRILSSSQSTSRFTETDDTFVKSVVESEPRRSPSYEMRIGQSARTGYGYSSIGYSVQETQPSSQFDSHELPTEERRLIRNEETSEDTDEETNEETV